MSRLPPEFLNSLEGVKGFERRSFMQVHETGEQVTSVRLNPRKPVSDIFPGAQQVPWTISGFYLQQRPSFTFDPLFHAGCYYVQDASSMFLEQPLKQLTEPGRAIRVLDLCGAPGGKSTHIQSLLTEGSVLVSNEVLRNRNLVLIDNIVKWGASNVMVTNNDPSAFRKLEGYFDMMIVDAPCSGSGLFRKDVSAVEEWSLNNVQLCCQRQQRILADALSSLKSGGILVYSTCSYSQEEDEDIADWLTGQMQMEPLELAVRDEWNIVVSRSRLGATGYRFFPDKLKGEGFFISCFRKKGPTINARIKTSKPDRPGALEKNIIRSWIQFSEDGLIKDQENFYALDHSLFDCYHELKNILNIQYKGVGLGQIMKGKLVPWHSLALSNIIAPGVSNVDLSYDDAIRYLQRRDVNFNSLQKGWQIVRYKGKNLGWVNVLPNRVNNYYPKELRILKQWNDTTFEK